MLLSNLFRFGRSAVVFALLLLPFTLSAEELRFSSRAYLLDSGEFFYSGTHVVSLAGGRPQSTTVRFSDPAGKLIGTQRTSPGVGYIPAYRFEDLRSGRFVEITPGGSRIQLKFRKSEGEQLQNSTLALASGAVAGSGLDQFIRAKWDALIAGQTISCPFLVAERKEYFTFRILPKGRRTIRGREAAVFQLYPDSYVLRLFFKEMYISYDVENKLPLTFRGPALFPDKDGKERHVRVDYYYSK